MLSEKTHTSYKTKESHLYVKRKAEYKIKGLKLQQTTSLSLEEEHVNFNESVICSSPIYIEIDKMTAKDLPSNCAFCNIHL